MMEKFLVGGLLLLALCSPLILLFVLIRMVRRRKKREALGLSKKPHMAYANVLDPFSFSENWLTCILLFVLVILYAGEITFATDSTVGSAPSVMTLLALGGVSRGLVVNVGEWYRVFTAPFLHAGILHLLLNGVALFYAGRILEKQIGRAWFLTVYLLGGVGGSLLSIMRQDILSVGASGAIMGLFAAMMAVSFHASSKEKRQGLCLFSLRVLLPSLVPQASNNGLSIDYAAHFGGVIGGGFCAVIMLTLWPAESPLPLRRGSALIVAILGIAMTIISFSLVAVKYPGYAALGKYRQVCLENLKQGAQKSGTDITNYVKDNPAYLSNCVNSFYENHPN